MNQPSGPIQQSATDTATEKPLGSSVHVPPDVVAPNAARPRLWLYTIPALLLALLAALVYSRVETRAHARAELLPATGDTSVIAVPVDVVRPRRADPNQNLTLPGDVQAYVETPIYARTNGYLKKWYVDIGGHVKAGQLLATIETPEVDQQLQQAEAAQLQAQANLDLAKTTAERWQLLLKSDGVSQQEVDENNAAYKARQADLNAAIANVDRLKDLESFEQVTAPFAGVVTARNIDIGSLISAGNSVQLFRMAQIDTMRVYVNVPEGFSNDMQPGTSADMQIAEFPNRTFAGSVVRSAGAIDTTSRTLLTEVDVPNPKGQLMPGSYSQVTFHLRVSNAPLVVPSNTLLFRAAGPQVVIVDAKNMAHLRDVTLGRDFGNSLEIISGVQPEDSVILNPPDSITDGTPVAVQQTEAAPAPAAAGH